MLQKSTSLTAPSRLCNAYCCWGVFGHNILVDYDDDLNIEHDFDSLIIPVTALTMTMP